MGQVRMFRDRVVSMEQTQEIGEKHVDLLTALAVEALPGFSLTEHGLEHEQDLYVLTLSNADSGETRRVSFTRMVLSDADRIPAVAADLAAPVRARIVDVIRGQAARREILVSLRQLLTEEERVEADEIDAEWRKKHEAALAAKRAEDERRARERQKQKQAEEARRQAQRERERRQRAAQGAGPGRAQPGAPQQPAEGGGRRRRRRGRGGARGGSGAGAAVAAGPDAATAQARAPQPPRPPRPQGAEAGGPRPEGGGGGRRRRRRGRGRGPGGNPGSAGGGTPPPV